MGLAKRAAADAAVTFLWAFSIAALPALARALAHTLSLDALFVIVPLVALHIVSFGALSELLDGASFNPTASLALALTRDSLSSLAVAVPAQMAGAAGGVRAIRAAMPASFQDTLQGPALKVTPLTGAAAEAALTFAITLVVLWAVLRNPTGGVAAIVAATLALVGAGEPYTGPAMNPANAFGWALSEGRHLTWEHFAVYWAGPTVGTLAAVAAFQSLFGRDRAPASPAPQKLKAQ